MRRAIEAELDRLRLPGDRLTLEVWDDGRCRIACKTAMRIARCTDLLDLLRGIPARTSWNDIWLELFDFPEAPD